MLTRSYTEALEAALGQVVREARREFEVHQAKSDALLAAMQARLTETELRCKALEAAAKEAIELRLSALRDGKDADPKEVERMVAEAVARIPAPRDGKDADPKEVDALRSEVAEVRAAVSEIVIPAAPDLSSFATKDDLVEAIASIPAPEPIDLTGFATKEDVEVVRAAIPPVPDLSSFATKDDLVEVVRAIPEMPEIPVVPEVDLSGLATKAEVEAVRLAIPAEPDLTNVATLQDVEAVKASIPASPDLSGFATKADLAALEPARHGKDVDMDEVRRMIGDAVAALPPAKDGADADMDAILRHVDETVAAAVPSRDELRGPEGRLPAVKAWVDAVHYEGAVVAHRGALYQAATDTGREPPHADWTCLAARGADGRSVDVRGTYDDGGEYRALDIVALNGGSFIALRDDPGPCPGDGWQLLAGRGKPGQAIKGEKGDKGDSVQGEPGRDADEVAGFYRDGDEIVMTFANGRELRA